MLVEFKISNFRSFKEEVAFSMEPLSQNGKNYNVIDTGLKRIPQVYRTSGIFGANASGKSNLLSGLAFLRLLVKSGASVNKDDKIPDERYALAGADFAEPTTMEVQFIVKDNLYKYGLNFRNDIIEKESLFFYPISPSGSAKPNRIFERSNVNGEINFEKSTGILQSWSNETLDNRLFLSQIVNNHKCEIKEVLDAYNWFTQTLNLVDAHQVSEGFSLNKIAEGKGDKIIQLMKKADLGLDKITVRAVPLEELQSKAKEKDKKIPQKIIEALLNGKANIFDAKSFHKTEDGKQKEFDFDNTESDGTKSFLSLAGPFLETIENGEVIVVDELDDSLHPHLVKHLVELFNNAEINKNNAQLIFTSHAHYLMDGETLSRDQIWFVSKEPNDGFYSSLYSLSDFGAMIKRKNISFYEAYMNGVYGAVPFVEKS